MKLEVGMYVRSKVNGLIGKIANIEELVNEKGVLYYELEQKGSGYGFCSTEIDSVKASFDIMDLIEVGDYVNGLIVERNKYGELYTSYVYYGGDIGKQCEVYTNWLKEFEEDMIQSIITHEQMEQISYKVKE